MAILHCCVIMHNMVVEVRAGGLVGLGNEDVSTSRDFPLFGHNQVTEGTAALDGVDLFAARMEAFDAMMLSITEHYKLKNDLVEHITSSLRLS